MSELTPDIGAGTEWLIDAANCSADALRDESLLSEVFARVIREVGLRVVGEIRWHSFPDPGGVTGFAMLSESHLCCHTYPEFQTATFNLYCCNERPAWDWSANLRELLGAWRVKVRVISRNIGPARPFQPAEAEQGLRGGARK